MSNQDENSCMRTTSDKILNFNQYESHLDGIINQYKTRNYFYKHSNHLLYFNKINNL